MKHLSKAGGSTFALLLPGHSASASHIGPIISDEAAAIILAVLVFTLISTITAYAIAVGDLRHKTRPRRMWSFILSLPMTIIGFIALTFIPIVGLIIIALVVPLWVMIYKTLSDDVAG